VQLQVGEDPIQQLVWKAVNVENISCVFRREISIPNVFWQVMETEEKLWHQELKPPASGVKMGCRISQRQAIHS